MSMSTWAWSDRSPRAPLCIADGLPLGWPSNRTAPSMPWCMSWDPAAQAVGQGRQVQKSVHLVREVGGVDDEDVTDDKRVAQAPLAQRRRPRPPDVGGNVGYQQWFEKAGHVFAGVTAHLQGELFQL